MQTAATASTTSVLRVMNSRAVFAEDLAPRQLLAAYPGRWRDEREISVEIYRIRRTLRKDAGLSRLLGLDDDKVTR